MMATMWCMVEEYWERSILFVVFVKKQDQEYEFLWQNILYCVSDIVDVAMKHRGKLCACKKPPTIPKELLIKTNMKGFTFFKVKFNRKSNYNAFLRAITDKSLQ